jgi:hypothetical protein
MASSVVLNLFAKGRSELHGGSARTMKHSYDLLYCLLISIISILIIHYIGLPAFTPFL